MSGQGTCGEELDKAALRALLNLAELGARADGARFAPRTSEVWSVLARCATGHGSVMVTSVSRFPPSGAADPEGATMTVTEAARLMGLSRGHVRRLCRRGAIRCRRFGERMWLIDADAVTDWRRAA